MMIGQMTGKCHTCKSRIRDKAVMANVGKRGEITKYCSHKCRHEDVGKPKPHFKFDDEDENSHPWS